MSNIAFSLFEHYPFLIHGMSRKQDGTMRAAGMKDRPEIAENRKRFFERLHIPDEQTVAAVLAHGTAVRRVTKADRGSAFPETDGFLTNERDVFLTVTGADCFPVFLFDPDRTAIALVHAGWKGIVRGIVPAAIEGLREAFGTRPERCLAGIGPGLHACHFAFDHGAQEVFREFPDCIHAREGSVFVDLPEIIRRQLQASGVVRERVETDPTCTACHPESRFSYRRDRPDEAQAMVAYFGLRHA